MKPSQIRTELLAQHEGLRGLIGAARAVVAVLRETGQRREELRGGVESITAALRSHNQREESVLRTVLQAGDSEGAARAELVDASHIEEHTGLLAALFATGGASDAELAGKGVLDVLDRILLHMAHEEETLFRSVPPDVRADLLAQHEGVRVLIGEARKVAGHLRGATQQREELQASIELLATALRLHNQREEAVLRHILKTADAWGPARIEIMDESHAEEHIILLAALFGSGGASDAESACTGVSHVLDRLEAHMAREEEVLLDDSVLRDDDVVIEYIGS
jgi:iron-sulfur cluster repair protein YtfE (RIC family)